MTTETRCALCRVAMTETEVETGVLCWDCRRRAPAPSPESTPAPGLCDCGHSEIRHGPGFDGAPRCWFPDCRCNGYTPMPRAAPPESTETGRAAPSRSDREAALLAECAHYVFFGDGQAQGSRQRVEGGPSRETERGRLMEQLRPYLRAPSPSPAPAREETPDAVQALRDLRAIGRRAHVHATLHADDTRGSLQIDRDLASAALRYSAAVRALASSPFPAPAREPEERVYVNRPDLCGTRGRCVACGGEATCDCATSTQERCYVWCPVHGEPPAHILVRYVNEADEHAETHKRLLHLQHVQTQPAPAREETRAATCDRLLREVGSVRAAPAPSETPPSTVEGNVKLPANSQPSETPPAALVTSRCHGCGKEIVVSREYAGEVIYHPECCHLGAQYAPPAPAPSPESDPRCPWFADGAHRGCDRCHASTPESIVAGLVWAWNRHDYGHHASPPDATCASMACSDVLMRARAFLAASRSPESETAREEPKP